MTQKPLICRKISQREPRSSKPFLWATPALEPDRGTSRGTGAFGWLVAANPDFRAVAHKSRFMERDGEGMRGVERVTRVLKTICGPFVGLEGRWMPSPELESGTSRVETGRSVHLSYEGSGSRAYNQEAR